MHVAKCVPIGISPRSDSSLIPTAGGNVGVVAQSGYDDFTCLGPAWPSINHMLPGPERRKHHRHHVLHVLACTSRRCGLLRGPNQPRNPVYNRRRDACNSEAHAMTLVINCNAPRKQVPWPAFQRTAGVSQCKDRSGIGHLLQLGSAPKIKAAKQDPASWVHASQIQLANGVRQY